MSRQARFFPKARQDLIEQATYFAEHATPAVADRFLESVERTVASLARMPSKGRPWQGQKLLHLRVWKVHAFPKMLIFYRQEEDGLAVVRILHSSRDLGSLLEGQI